MYELTKISYTHDAMIDLVIAHPAISQGELAARFGYTESWISQVFCSDAFQMRLEERKAELVDPAIRATIEEELASVARLSAHILRERLVAGRSGELAERALATSTKALGYGARQASPPGVQNNFVVLVPGKAATSKEWENAYTPAIAGQVT